MLNAPWPATLDSETYRIWELDEDDIGRLKSFVSSIEKFLGQPHIDPDLISAFCFQCRDQVHDNFFDKIYDVGCDIIEDLSLNREDCKEIYLQQIELCARELSSTYQAYVWSCSFLFPSRSSNGLLSRIVDDIKTETESQIIGFSGCFRRIFRLLRSRFRFKFLEPRILAPQDQSARSASPASSFKSGLIESRDSYTKEGDVQDIETKGDIAESDSAKSDSSEGDRSEDDSDHGGNTEDGEPTEEDYESSGRNKDKLEHLWNHLTISRDRTSAANTEKELLFIFQGSSLELKQEKSRQTENKRQLAATLQIAQFQSKNSREDWSHRESQTRSPGIFHPYRVEQTFVSRHQDSLSRYLKTAHNMAGTSSHTTVGGLTEPWTPAQQVGVNLVASSKTKDLLSHKQSEEVYYELRKKIALLEDENKTLKDYSTENHNWQILHFIQTDPRLPASVFLDEPTWSITPKSDATLASYLPVTDVNGFLKHKQGVDFVVSRYYNSQDGRNNVARASKAQKQLPSARWFKETISLNSEVMIDAAKAFFDQKPTFKEEFPDFNLQGHIQAPYLFWYRYRSENVVEMANMSQEHQALMRGLTDWIEKNYKDTYDLVEAQMSRGVISQDTMLFLAKPGDVVVWEHTGKLSAAVAKSWPWQEEAPILERKSLEREWGKETSTNSPKCAIKWTLEIGEYEYDGGLTKEFRDLDIEFKANWVDEELEIRKLSVYPLRFASENIRNTLEKRGRTFWRCRYRNVVSYEDSAGFYGNGERFIVDFHTYRQLHPDFTHLKKFYPNASDPKAEVMSDEMMECEEPPGSPDIYVLPYTVPGYDLRTKKWLDLEVDQIRDVTWNKKSFDHLVVDEETKELVQALVMRQIAREKSTDIIDRKGNGLIMLLHGGPGTGKTFTAESVAELAEKPLFRVTCGDISTDPEKAEKYLDSVLHLGKTWGCVVLIDEAEVFLEQRSLDNLERNALVSVFLRVLEYYEGILILTSNRVGTFDEAFKSRILLSLHYDNLTQGQRMRIWKNFLRRLKDMENGPITTVNTSKDGILKKPSEEETAEIDFDDIECYLKELAEYDLNGRQIRNAITSARQLAMFRNKPMCFSHLKHVITVSSKFDNYLKKVQEGQTADQIARIDGIR